MFLKLGITLQFPIALRLRNDEGDPTWVALASSRYASRSLALAPLGKGGGMTGPIPVEGWLLEARSDVRGRGRVGEERTDV
jgi:hypothetical protein